MRKYVYLVRMANDIKEINREFYNNAYSSNNVLLGLLHTLFSYDQQSKSRLNYREIKAVLKLIEPGSKVNFLDYGFGHGSLLLKLPRQVSVYGCDIAEEAVFKLEKIAEMLKRDIKVTTVENFDSFTKGVKFDLISCSHVLEHVDDDNEMVNEFKKLLTSNGKLIINLPVNEVWIDPKHARTYTSKSASSLLESNGFKILKIIEEDKLTAFFLTHEVSSTRKSPLKLAFRFLRLAFGILPLEVSQAAGKLLPKKYQNQQLIIIAANNG